ncbi:MAG: Hpt domain-containing protein [Hydrogenibacillus schlegelii]|nr:Hpt domain-containing protein [Hydrogenibacillus schlegelii]
MLGPEAERRLAAQLIRTLKEAEAAIAQAWSTGDRARLSRLGHALKGNSGAHYFGLSVIREAGAALEAAFRPAGRPDPTVGEAPRTTGPDPPAQVSAASADESGAGGAFGPEAGKQAVEAARQAIAAAIAALRERFPVPGPDER